MKVHYKIKAGALYLALAISLVFFAVVSALLLGNYLHNEEVEALIRNEQNLEHSIMGLTFIPEVFKVQGPGFSGEQRLFNNPGSPSVFIGTKDWGLFKVGFSVAHTSGWRDTTHALFGESYRDEQLPVLYLADLNTPLSLCGKTKISGNAKLPRSGAKRAYIEGRNYHFSNLIHGNTGISKSTLPEVDFSVSDRIPRERTARQVEWAGTDFTNRFSGKTVELQGAHVKLTGKLSGNIVINNTGLLRIAGEAVLDNVIIISDSVIVEAGFRGNCQIYSRNKIEVGTNVQMEYPSVLAITGSQACELSIGSGTSVSGCIYVSGSKQMDPQKLLVSENAVVNGLVYVNGDFQHKGSVNGSVFARRFVLKTSFSFYTNHLLDAEIDDELPDEFGLPFLMEGVEQVTEIKKMI